MRKEAEVRSIHRGTWKWPSDKGPLWVFALWEIFKVVLLFLTAVPVPFSAPKGF